MTLSAHTFDFPTYELFCFAFGSCVCFAVLRMETMALHMLGKCLPLILLKLVVVLFLGTPWILYLMTSQPQNDKEETG